MPRCSAVPSGHTLEVRAYDPNLAQQAREMQDFPVAGSLSLPCEAQRLDGDIQPEFVSVFEAVNERACDAIDANGDAIDPVDFNTLIKGCGIETIDLHRRRAQPQPPTTCS